MRFLQRYKKKLERKFSPQIERQGFNFQCDVTLANKVRLLATWLECPVYVVAEHLLELGMAEMGVMLLDDALTEHLQRHLLEEHLLVKHLDPEHETVSERVLRLQNAMEFLELYESRALSPLDIMQALRQAVGEVREKRA